MAKPSEALFLLLDTIRNHPAFSELISSVERPIIPEYRKSKAANVEEARADWIFASGQKAQHDKWMLLLTGRVPQNAE